MSDFPKFWKASIDKRSVTYHLAVFIAKGIGRTSTRGLTLLDEMVPDAIYSPARHGASSKTFLTT